MKNIKLTTRGGRDVVVNWENVNYALTTSNPYESKKEYVEIHCGNQQIDVKESLQEIASSLQRLLLNLKGEELNWDNDKK